MLSGQPTCPEMLPEQELLKKEISQGKAKFKLQFMLDTSLADEERYPLKVSNLIVADFNNDKGPALPVWTNNSLHLYRSAGIGGKFKLYRAVPSDYEMRKFDQTVMYIDPAGGGKNGDEMAYAVIKLIGAYVYIAAIGGVPGGYEESKLLELVRVAKRYGAKTVCIEKNFGHGAHANMIKPLFAREKWPVTLEEVYEAGQKELRIIDVVEPLLSSHRLVISSEALESDAKSVTKYPIEIQTTYRLIHQMAMLTRDKGCLRHDDRLDALAGAIRFVVERLDFDTQVVIEARRRHEELEHIRMWKDPVSRRTWLTGVAPRGGRNSIETMSKAGGNNRRATKSRNSFNRSRF